MTGAAENRLRDVLEELDFLVYQAPGLFRVDLHLVFLGICDNASRLRIAGGSVNRIRQTALDQRQTAADLVVALVHAMTHDASDAFARRRVAIQIGNDRTLAESFISNGLRAGNPPCPVDNDKLEWQPGP